MVYKGRGRREDSTECAIAQVNKMNPVSCWCRLSSKCWPAVSLFSLEE